MLYIMGWTLTDACTRILKGVINHTRNIQSKDFERLPYPIWLSVDRRQAAIQHVRHILDAAIHGKRFDFDSPEIKRLDDLFEYRYDETRMTTDDGCRPRQSTLY